MDNYHDRQCLNCQKQLNGRIDKKYCDADCRNAYHNKEQRFSERMILAVNRQLRKNRTILKALWPLGKATVRKEVLVKMGFRFQYFSSIYTVKNGKYYFSYEYGYCPIMQMSTTEKVNVPKVLIIQKQEFMNTPFDPWKLSYERMRF